MLKPTSRPTWPTYLGVGCRGGGNGGGLLYLTWYTGVCDSYTTHGHALAAGRGGIKITIF